MLYFVPLLTYLAAMVLVIVLMRGLGTFRSHILFWMFAAYSAPYALRFALQSTFVFPFSSVDLLDANQFLRTSGAMATLLVLSAAVYRISFQLSLAGVHRDKAKATHWTEFTRVWGSLIFRYLLIVAGAAIVLGLFVRFVVQGERFALGFAADVESRQASMGWGFVPFILAQITLAVLLIAVELRRARSELALLFVAIVLLALASGSKGGFITPLTYCLAFAVHRGRLRVNVRLVLGVIVVGVCSLVLGVSIRGYIESGAASPFGALSAANLIGPAIGRFFAYDITQIMLARPATYAPIVADFRAYFVSAAVPAAFWPDKPLNPCLLLADSVGFPFVSCVAPGWVGGLLVLAGPIGAALAPLVVGVGLARLSWRTTVATDTPSLRYPLSFIVGLLWLGMINEGTYYQFIPVFLPIVTVLTLVYFGILLINGRIGQFPGLGAAQRDARLPRGAQ